MEERQVTFEWDVPVWMKPSGGACSAEDRPCTSADLESIVYVVEYSIDSASAEEMTTTSPEASFMVEELSTISIRVGTKWYNGEVECWSSWATHTVPRPNFGPCGNPEVA